MIIIIELNKNETKISERWQAANIGLNREVLLVYRQLHTKLQ